MEKEQKWDGDIIGFDEDEVATADDIYETVDEGEVPNDEPKPTVVDEDIDMDDVDFDA